MREATGSGRRRSRARWVAGGLGAEQRGEARGRFRKGRAAGRSGRGEADGRRKRDGLHVESNEVRAQGRGKECAVRRERKKGSGVGGVD